MEIFVLNCGSPKLSKASTAKILYERYVNKSPHLTIMPVSKAT